MAKFIFRFFINALALYAAVALVPGIVAQNPDDPYAYLWLALIFGLVNTFIRPAVKFITCLINVFTLGLFILVINTGMFALTVWIGREWFDVGFTIDNPIWWWAFLGALVVSVIDWVFRLIVPDRRFGKKRPKVKINK